MAKYQPIIGQSLLKSWCSRLWNRRRNKPLDNSSNDKVRIYAPVSHLTLFCGLFYGAALMIFVFLALTLITDQFFVLHTVLSQSLSVLSAQISILCRLCALHGVSHPARLPFKQWVEQPLQHTVQQLTAVALRTARLVLPELLLTQLEASLAQTVSAGQQERPFTLAAWAQGVAGGWRWLIVWHCDGLVVLWMLLSSKCPSSLNVWSAALWLLHNHCCAYQRKSPFG